MTGEPLVRRWRALQNRLADLRAARAAAPPRLPGVDSVVFVCLGNICRSLYAERYAAALSPGVFVTSAGLGAGSQGRTPEAGLRVAAERGVDLCGHVPRRLSEIGGPADRAFLVMEPWQFRHAALADARRRGRVFLLGHWCVPPVGAIRDPFGGEPEEFRACFAQLETAVARIVDDLHGRTSR